MIEIDTTAIYKKQNYQNKSPGKECYLCGKIGIVLTKGIIFLYKGGAFFEGVQIWGLMVYFLFLGEKLGVHGIKLDLIIGRLMFHAVLRL
ncbi:hypothetical protein [Desulfosporosinus sp. OT]|uniref:hypothetical protein n=1 Tax=Desulfosporosinus sp. OT TaxID=913865 RepID=UPI000590506F|nr:hypothetical protein [Desulfosporosinus sp. OT]